MAHRTPKWPHCASDGITYSSSPSLLCSRHPIVLALPHACEASSSPMASPHTAWSALTVPPWDHLLTPSASSGLCSITSITVGLFLATGFQITTATPSQTPFPRFLIFRSRIITAWHPDLCMSDFSSVTHFSVSRSPAGEDLSTLAPIYIMAIRGAGEEQDGKKEKGKRRK